MFALIATVIILHNGTIVGEPQDIWHPDRFRSEIECLHVRERDDPVLQANLERYFNGARGEAFDFVSACVKVGKTKDEKDDGDTQADEQAERDRADAGADAIAAILRAMNLIGFPGAR